MTRKTGLTGPAFRELSFCGIRELIRDPGGFFLMMIFPFLIMGLTALLGLASIGQTYTVGLVVPENASEPVQRLIKHLEQEKYLKLTPVSPTAALEQVGQEQLSAVLALPAELGKEPVRIVVGRDQTSAGTKLRKWVQKGAGGLDSAQIEVRDLSGQEAAELQVVLLPFTLLICFWFLSFYSIGFYIIQVRQRGTLKLLGLTPVSRMTYVLSLVPGRLALATAQLLVIMLIGAATGMISISRVPGALGSALLGILMIFSFGYLVGGVFKVAEAALVLPTALLPAVTLMSGFLFPVESLPPWVTKLSQFVPFSYMADTLKHFLVGSPFHYSPWLSYAVMLGTTAVVTMLTARTFRWDQGEGR